MGLRVGLDLDGVCYDFNGASCYLLEEHFGLVVPKEWPHWNYPIDWLVENGHTKKPWNWLWKPSGGIGAGLFRHGHVLKGAVRAAHALASLGELVIITKRPTTARADTLMWLGFHNFPTSEVHVLDRGTKSEVVPHCDMYIDDSLDNCRDLYNNTQGMVLLWDQPWNRSGAEDLERRDVSRFRRVTSWQEVMEWAKTLNSVKKNSAA